MGDDAALVEQTNFSQCEGAGAHRADAPRTNAEALQRGQSPPIFPKHVNSGPPGMSRVSMGTACGSGSAINFTPEAVRIGPPDMAARRTAERCDAPSSFAVVSACVGPAISIS